MIKNCDDWCDFAPIEQCPIPQEEEAKRDKTFNSMVVRENMTMYQRTEISRRNKERKLLNKKIHEIDKLRMKLDPEYSEKGYSHNTIRREKNYIGTIKVK